MKTVVFIETNFSGLDAIAWCEHGVVCKIVINRIAQMDSGEIDVLRRDIHQLDELELGPARRIVINL